MEDGEQHWPCLEDVCYPSNLLKVYSNATKALWGQGQSYLSSRIQLFTFCCPLMPELPASRPLDSGISTNVSSFYNHYRTYALLLVGWLALQL